MIKQFKYKTLTWYDLSSPTEEDIREVVEKFSIHSVAAAEISNPSLRSKVDLYDNFIYLVLQFPNHNNSLETSNEGNDPVEIDFIVGKDFLISVSYQHVDSMQEFGKIFETSTVLSSAKKETHAGYLLYYIIRHLYQSLDDNLHFINSHLKKSEEKIFAGDEREMVMVLATINRKLLDFRGILKSHKEVLLALERAGEEFFGAKFIYYLRAISGESQKVWASMENSREFFNELKQTNDSLLQIKTGEATKIFSMLAFVTFPLSLLAAVMSLRAPGTPLVDMKYGFWLIAGIMLALILLMMSFFKYKRWL